MTSPRGLSSAGGRRAARGRLAAGDRPRGRRGRPAGVPLLPGVLAGAAIGLLAGLTGTGGGIFLTPLLVLAGWTGTRDAAGLSGAFILANSIAGLAGLAIGGVSLPTSPHLGCRGGRRRARSAHGWELSVQHPEAASGACIRTGACSRKAGLLALTPAVGWRDDGHPRAAPSAHGSEPLRLVGADTDVPLVTGGARRYLNLDYAASAPAPQAVHDAVEELLGWYSSVHRGAGFKSRASTAAYEGARESIRRFVKARTDDAVIITRNTTDSINLLRAPSPRAPTWSLRWRAPCQPPAMEADRRPISAVPETPAEMLEQLNATLRDLPHCEDPHLVAVTGATNVTGEIWPVAEIARVAHQYGARLLVDAAQPAPHAPIDMQRDGIDYLALSGHKLYAPYGAGALIGERDWLSTGDPFLRGGGAVKLVTVEETLWAELPDRQEAGSPT